MDAHMPRPERVLGRLMKRWVDPSSIRIAAAALGVVALTAGPSLAGYSRGGGFAAPGYGARAWGMAGAAAAARGDESSVYWNPAFLTTLDNQRIGFSYVNLVPGAEARQSYLAYARALQQGPADDPELPYARHAAGAIFSNLSLELSDGQKYAENSLRLAYAYCPEYFISAGIGVNLHFSSSDIGSFDSRGSSIDAGLRVVLLQRLDLGIVLRNAVSRIVFDEGSDEVLQRSLTLAVASGIAPRLAVETDATFAYGSLARFAVGAESLFFTNTLAVRWGAAIVTAGENRTIPYLGIGIRLERIGIDYSAGFDDESAFEDTHRFSLGVDL